MQKVMAVLTPSECNHKTPACLTTDDYLYELWIMAYQKVWVQLSVLRAFWFNWPKLEKEKHQSVLSSIMTETDNPKPIFWQLITLNYFYTSNTESLENCWRK